MATGHVNPTPVTPRNYTVQYKEDSLSADPDLMLKQVNQFPVELMEQLILQGIGGAELISIVRQDEVDGQKTIYQPISNLEQLKQEYNPQTITRPSATLVSFRSIHGITDDSADGSPVTPDTVRLSNTTQGVVIEVELEEVPIGVAIEVATSYSFSENLTSSPSEMVYYVGGAAPDEAEDRQLIGGAASGSSIELVSGGSAYSVDYVLDSGTPGSIDDSYVDGGNATIFGSDLSVDGGTATPSVEIISPAIYGGRGSYYGPVF